jgi:hypothetical protein
MARELTSPIQTREFEAFRKRIVSNHKPVSAESRAAWFEAFQESLPSIFPGRRVEFKKPGQPMGMFKGRVQLAPEDKYRWEEIYDVVERYWRQRFAPGREVQTYAGFDGPRLVFEFALLDGEHYLTGSVTVDRWIEEEPEQERFERPERDRPPRWERPE